MQIAAMGVYVNDNPQPGEASITSAAGAYFVYAALSGTHITPVDTIVTLNGVPLMHAPGIGFPYFTVDPTGPLPVPAADGFLHITASSASAQSSRVLNLPCPGLVPVVSNPAAGSSLAGSPTLEFSWGDLGAVPGILFNGPVSIGLMPVDAVTGVPAGIGTGTGLAMTDTGVSLAVPALGPAGSAYRATMIVYGNGILDGNTGGICGRVQSWSYAQ
jgi:hypothetical protein